MHRIERAILIDDEQFEHLAFQRLLKGSSDIGQVLSFHYSDEALDYLSEAAPHAGDLIFLDINMPRMNGFEFLDAAAHRFGQDMGGAVIAMLTTSLNPSDRARALDHPAVRDFLSKPLARSHIARARAYIPDATDNGRGGRARD